MVESLAPMWVEEAARCGPGGIPDAPPSPPRSPRVLCPAVHAVRQQFADIAAEQEEQLQQEEQAAGPAPTPAAAQAAQAPAATPVPTAMPTQAAAGTPLLAMTQAANQAVLPPGTGPEEPSRVQQQPAGPARRSWLPAQVAAVGDQTPATPAGLTQLQLGGLAGGGGALLDEALLLTQLTEAQQRRQQQLQQQAWGPSQQAPAGGDGGALPRSQQATQMDADARAWLQASWGGVCLACATPSALPARQRLTRTPPRPLITCSGGRRMPRAGTAAAAATRRRRRIFCRRWRSRQPHSARP